MTPFSFQEKRLWRSGRSSDSPCHFNGLPNPKISGVRG